MHKPRLPAIEYIRGISMLGVIGIHLGAQYLTNPLPNVHLLAVFEIFTRFSVPIFFFISAFGLFYNLAPDEKFSYAKFLRRRGRAVLIPYIVWSLFYLELATIVHGVPFPSPVSFLHTLFFGLAQYQLYFLVILLWFYLLMPLWIYIVRRLDKKKLASILLLQIAINYYSSFSSDLYAFTIGLPDNSLLKSLLQYRLNYWVGHYFFIFLLGGWLAWRFDEFKTFMQHRRSGVIIAFFLSLIALTAYYYSLLMRGYTPLEAIFTAHQLCPLGVIYTITASIFFFMIFSYQNYTRQFNSVLSFLGRHSYFAYLVHPVFISLGNAILTRTEQLMTARIAVIFYFGVLLTSLVTAQLCRQIGNKIPLLNLLTIGISHQKN